MREPKSLRLALVTRKGACEELAESPVGPYTHGRSRVGGRAHRAGDSHWIQNDEVIIKLKKESRGSQGRQRL